MASLLPLSSRRALRALGENIAVARKRRRISTVSMAERADISRATLVKIEKGDASVSMASYLSVLTILGFEARLPGLAAPETDEIGIVLDEERLPQRIRS